MKKIQLKFLGGILRIFNAGSAAEVFRSVETDDDLEEIEVFLLSKQVSDLAFLAFKVFQLSSAEDLTERENTIKAVDIEGGTVPFVAHQYDDKFVL